MKIKGIEKIGMRSKLDNKGKEASENLVSGEKHEIKGLYN